MQGGMKLRFIPQLPATTNICNTRGCNYSFWAPDDGRCVARNLL